MTYDTPGVCVSHGLNFDAATSNLFSQTIPLCVGEMKRI